VWALEKTGELMNSLSDEQRNTIYQKMNLDESERLQWKKIASNINIVIQDNILAQYDGYFDLKELDWDHYKEKYGNIYRMDRLLKAEGKSADDYKVAKQADTLQTFYNLNEETVNHILDRLGYSLPENYLAENLAYYLKRTSHGSTLSRVVHAQLAKMIEDHRLSWTLYQDALTSDYGDIQGGTTGEGIHAGVMAGTVIIALQSFAGLDLRGDVVKINPSLPEHWRRIRFNFGFMGHDFFVDVNKDQLSLRMQSSKHPEVEVEVKGKRTILVSGQEKVLHL
jgi:trehalose/maltose hydrolase-like predicted phosphorylase